ncbi:hypothetical protein AB0D09_10370 [Streptomyces sp. NPDC049097]|uniref:hypothetical protein n=1 Tax=Streptomyces sp. NPDC049097 TaxID=3155497 RepID=UPI00343EF146
MGIAVRGLPGTLPMTAVIVHSAANMCAGPRTEASRVLHGVWLLVFTALLLGGARGDPGGRARGLLVHARCALVPLREAGVLWRAHRGEAVVVLTVTAVGIVVGNLFEGVPIGPVPDVTKTAWDISRVQAETEDPGAEGIVVRVRGHAAFPRLPKPSDAPGTLPRDRDARVEPDGLRHLDHACAAALEGWAAARGQDASATTRNTS